VVTFGLLDFWNRHRKKDKKMNDFFTTPESPKGQNPPKGQGSAESAPQWKVFGATPRYLAAGLRVRPELLLTYLASVLGGLAGPFARMSGFFGERHAPAIPLTLAVGHAGRARHLQQLAVEPALRFDDWSRRKVQALDPKWFEEHHRFEGCRVRQAQLGLMEELERDIPDQDRVAGDRNTLLRHQQNLQPLVMLTSPDPKGFDQIRGSVSDECPLIFDGGGRLIRNSVLPHRKQSEWQQLLERIVAGAHQGVDQPAGTSGVETLNSTRRTRTPFLFHLPRELAGMALLHPATADLFEVGLLVPTETISSHLIPSEENHATARQCLGRYQNAVNEVLWSRLDNSGVALSLAKPMPELIEGQDELEDRLDSLPSMVRRYCGGLYGLPLRLLWTALLIDDPKARNVDRYVAGVLATARWCIDRQVGLIREALETEKRRELEEAAVVMWRKLCELGRPCKLGDLQRKYHGQRRDRLEPVLLFLAEQGLATWDPQQNQIELCLPVVRPEWLEERTSGVTAIT